jgi:hypothetical protein
VIELINRSLDLIKAYTLVAPVPTYQPYGRNLKIQNYMVDKKKVIAGMRSTSKTTMQIFKLGYYFYNHYTVCMKFLERNTLLHTFTRILLLVSWISFSCFLIIALRKWSALVAPVG